jgi:hypothetical protein
VFSGRVTVTTLEQTFLPVLLALAARLQRSL